MWRLHVHVARGFLTHWGRSKSLLHVCGEEGKQDLEKHRATSESAEATYFWNTLPRHPFPGLNDFMVFWTILTGFQVGAFPQSICLHAAALRSFTEALKKIRGVAAGQYQFHIPFTVSQDAYVVTSRKLNFSFRLRNSHVSLHRPTACSWELEKSLPGLSLAEVFTYSLETSIHENPPVEVCQFPTVCYPGQSLPGTRPRNSCLYPERGVFRYKVINARLLSATWWFKAANKSERLCQGRERIRAKISLFSLSLYFLPSFSPLALFLVFSAVLPDSVLCILFISLVVR